MIDLVEFHGIQYTDDMGTDPHVVPTSALADEAKAARESMLETFGL